MPPNLHPLLLDADTRREHLRQKSMSGLSELFPIIGKRTSLELQDLNIIRRDYSPTEQKDALMSGRTLQEPIQGSLILRDNKTGKILDKGSRTLLHLPFFTRRYTFIVGGNEYDVPSQLRLKSGVYTRERNNGEFEASFNLSKGRIGGAGFRLAMEPETGRIHMELGASKIPLYPLLRSLGIPDSEIAKKWGTELKDVNAALSGKEETILNKIISKLKRPGDTTPLTIEGKRAYIHDYFESTEMNPDVNERTLGQRFSKANASALLAASKKLIDVHKGLASEDDRDSLEFKTIHSADDFFKERLLIDAKRTIAKKLSARLNSATEDSISSIVPNSTFTKSINTFLTSSSLKSLPQQINPIEIIDYASKITSLGEGGISSERAVPIEARKVHNSHFGILDPIHTPDGLKTGIDVHSTLTAHRDDEGNLYAWMRDAKTSKMLHVPVMTLAQSVVAFPNQEHRTSKWDAFKGNTTVSVHKNEVDYILPDASHMFSPSTSLVPFINGMQGNRSLMASKFQTQALPLIEREAPYVQAMGPYKGVSAERELALLVAPTSSVHGTVEKIDDHYVYIRPDKVKTAGAGSDLVKIPYNTYYPLASKTYLHDELKVKVGDTVKPDQLLAESNFTRDGALALGKNLSVAYLAYYGKNSNDAVVLSDAASKKLTSEHMYKESLQKSPDILISKAKFTSYYGMVYTAEQLNKLDENGIIKKDQVVHKGDPLILALKKSTPTPESILLGNFHKSLVKPYKNYAVTWPKDVPGTVQDIANAARQVMVTIRTQEPMKIGDKLSNRFGGKGVVSEIIPQDRMIQDSTGKAVDVLFTSAGIISRINPAQIVEAALGKVVEKTGKPIVMPQFNVEDNVAYAKRLLKEHNISDKETVYDPVSGKHIPNIFVGRSFIHKLFKSTETNYAARGVAGYDVNMQPVRGGEEGSKGIGRMEINTLLAHNARNVLKEALTLKSEKSDEFWRAYEFSLPPPPSKTPFISEKFTAMLQGAGINVKKQGSLISLAPMTDKDVTTLSTGALSTPDLDKSKSYMVNSKTMLPEPGGLFDPNLTGGMSGTKWSHISLSEPIINPVFEDAVRRLLHLSKEELRSEIGSSGGEAIKQRLNKLSLDSLEKELLLDTKTARGPALDVAVKKLKYVRALKASGYTKAGDAYTLNKLAVIPPIMRPITVSGKGNDLQVSDLNYLYRDAGLASVALRNSKTTEVPDLITASRHHLYDSVAALFGTQRPTSPQLKGREAKGFIEQITGSGSPKSGFLHKKILKRQQDLTGRGTATPDNTLDIDQIGIPEDMLWTLYGKFMMRNLIGQGYKPLDAKKMIEDRHVVASDFLNREIKTRPMFVNRAPSLHKHNFVAAYPIPVPGKSLRINPFMERGQNLDYDGDAMQLHVPVTDAAVKEAQQMTLSNLLFSDRTADSLMVFPQHEALLGTYLSTVPTKGTTSKKFKTKKDAMDAYHRNEISINTPIEILESPR